MTRWTRVRILHVHTRFIVYWITETIHSIHLTQVNYSKEQINNPSPRCKRRIGILQRGRCFLSWTIHWFSLLILHGRFIMKHMRHPIDPMLHWVYGIENKDSSFLWLSVALSTLSPNEHLKFYFKSQFRSVFCSIRPVLNYSRKLFTSACFFPPLKRKAASWCHYAMWVCVYACVSYLFPFQI